MSLKLSQITSGGAVSPTTDQLVAVRSGATDVLVTPGQAAAKAVSNNTNTTVASVDTAPITANHIAQFADTAGTVKDGGVLGTAAHQAASSVTGTVAAVSGGTTIGHIATFSDTAGTLIDGGAAPSLGQAASKSVTDNTKSTVASVSGAFTINHLIVAADTAGTSKDGGAFSDANISISDITTNDVSISAHGFAPKAPNDATKFLDGTGNYSTPAGTSPSFVKSSGTATAAGSSSSAFGPGASSGGGVSVAIGSVANASGLGGVAIGSSSGATQQNTVGIGESAQAQGLGATAVGGAATAANPGSTVIGYSISDAQANDVIIGNPTWTVKVHGTTGNMTIPTGGVLLTTMANLSNGAGAQAATITNGPAAGNPTKWIPINDNGTTRYIPAW